MLLYSCWKRMLNQIHPVQALRQCVGPDGYGRPDWELTISAFAELSLPQNLLALSCLQARVNFHSTP